MAIKLTWTAAPDAATYTVKRATITGGPYTTIASGLTATTYTDSAVTPGITYFYTVTGINALGEQASDEIAMAAVAPDEIPMAGLVGWYSADEGLTIEDDGISVSAWADKSAAANHLTQPDSDKWAAKQPDWFGPGLANVFVGNSQLSGGQNGFECPISLDFPFTIILADALNYGMSGPGCLLWLDKVNVYQALDPQLGEGDPTWGLKMLGLDLSSGVTLNFGGEPTTIAVVGRAPDDIDLITNGPSFNDSYTIVTKNNGTSFPATGVKRIGNAGANGPSSGNGQYHGSRVTLAEIMIYSRALSPAEWQRCLARITNAHRLWP